eukprot:gene16032-19014_t
MAVPVACVFWDADGAHGGEYRSQGCIRKAARRRSVFQNLVNTEATLTLEGDPAEDRQPAEDGQPAGSVAEEPVAGAVAGNRADEIPECHAQFEASAEGSAAGGPVLESYQRAPPNMLTAIGLNVYQLHLSVPLVHLEELALRSRQAKPVVCAERGGNAKGAVQGRDPVTQEDIGLPAGGSVVENYKVDVEGEDAVALLQKGALGCGEVSEFPKLEPEIKATALQASPLRAPRNQ